MSQFRSLHNTFAGGQISIKAEARPDFKQYIGSCSEYLNYRTMRFGGATRRMGSRFVAWSNLVTGNDGSADEARRYYGSGNSQNYVPLASPTALIPYTVAYRDGIERTFNLVLNLSVTQHFVGDNTRVHLYSAHTGAIEISHSSAAGGNVNNFLDYNQGNYIGGTDNIQYAQYGNWLIVTCPTGNFSPVIIYPEEPFSGATAFYSIPVMGLTGHMEATLNYGRGQEYIPDNNAVPYSPVFNGRYGITTSAFAAGTAPVIGTSTLTTSGPSASGIYSLFRSNDVGRFIRFENATFSGSGYISSYTSANVVVVTWTEVSGTPPNSPFYDWQFSDWGAENGYPTAITNYNGRLFYGGSKGNPDMIWAAAVNNATLLNSIRALVPGSGATTILYSGDSKTDDPFNSTIGHDDFNEIRWAMGDERLVVGSSTGEATLHGGDSQLAGDNKISTISSTEGAIQVNAIRADGSIIFVGSDGKKLHRMKWDSTTYSYKTTDLNLLNPDIFDETKSEQITQITYVNTNKNIYALTKDADGSTRLISMTLNDETGISAWSIIELGGTYKITAISKINSAPDNKEVLNMAVERTLVSGTQYLFEILEHDLYDSWLDSSVFDAVATGNPAAAVWPQNSYTNTNYDHLIGETVTCVADGYKVYELVVADAGGGVGQITLPVAAYSLDIGYAYTSRLQTMPLHKGMTFETVVGAIGRIDECIVKMYSSSGGKIGYEATKLRGLLNTQVTYPGGYSGDLSNEFGIWQGGTIWTAASGTVTITGRTALKRLEYTTKDEVVKFPQGPERKSYVIIEQDQPFPCTVLSIAMKGFMNDFD